MKFFLIFLFFLSSCTKSISFEKKDILIKKKKILVEIADSYDKRSKGLMNRSSLNKNSGMLFVYSSEQNLKFWMKNTKIPLSIAFFNKEKQLLEVIKMPLPKDPNNLIIYQNSSPAKYALEMKLGWFQKNNISIGDKFKFSEDRK